MTEPAFFAPPLVMTVGEIAAIVGGSVADGGHADIRIERLAAIAEARPGALVFMEARKFGEALARSTASAVLCAADLVDLVPKGMAAIVVRSPARSFAALGRHMMPGAAHGGPLTDETGVSPAAHVDPTARVEAGAIVEAGAVVGASASIGAGAVIGPNAVIGRAVQIGRDSVVGACATVQHAMIGNRVKIHPGARIGQDGFGFIPAGRTPEKVPQIGRVIIQDDVEIGANTTIDRGTLGDTVIGEGSKIDNLVQIAHNVRIGRNCLIAAHVGLSGSVTLGDGAMLGGRVGIADHLTIGAGAQVAGSSGVMHDIPAGERWGGTPAQPAKEFFRELTTLRRLVSESRKSKGRQDG